MRRNYFPLIILLVCCVIAVGFYRGWFTFTSGREPNSNKIDASLTVDPDRMKHDAEKAAENTRREASDLSQKVKQEAKRLEGRKGDNGESTPK